jgi:hypothetical protein
MMMILIQRGLSSRDDVFAIGGRRVLWQLSPNLIGMVPFEGDRMFSFCMQIILLVQLQLSLSNGCHDAALQLLWVAPSP